MTSKRPALRAAEFPAGWRPACPSDLLRPAALALLLGLAACASEPTDPTAKAAFKEANDPIEPTNRAIFDANMYVDRNAIKPVAEAYKENVPEGVQHSVHNVVTNLNEPGVGLNQLLQGNVTEAWDTTQRFFVNTTLGGLGVFDVATDWDLPHRDADFGQTLGVWGVDEGPYMMLPFFGPSNPRDAVGTAVTMLMDPLAWVAFPGVIALNATRFAADAVDQRSAHLDDLDEIQRNSLDYYATLRSLYRQHRTDMVDQAEGKPPSDNSTLIPADAGEPDLPGAEPTGGAGAPAATGAPAEPPAAPPAASANPPAATGAPGAAASTGGATGKTQPGVQVEYAPAEPTTTP
jgi:phospholipid-binding lipoprotein MlaA